MGLQKSVFAYKRTFFVFIPFFSKKKANEEENIGKLDKKLGKFW